MSCEYCRHESIAYRHWKDGQNRDHYYKVAETIPYDECQVDADPVLSWWVEPHVIDWAGHRARLCLTAYDTEGYEIEISIPVKYCPMCGRELPRTKVVDE